PISEINRLCDMVQEIEGTPLYDALSEIDGYWFNNIEELLENKEDIICYTDCEDMADVARYRAEEEGIFAALPGHLQYYFDFVSYGRDLEINEDFLVTSHGVFKYYRYTLGTIKTTISYQQLVLDRLLFSLERMKPFEKIKELRTNLVSRKSHLCD